MPRVYKRRGQPYREQQRPEVEAVILLLQPFADAGLPLPPQFPFETKAERREPRESGVKA